jgi:uroporphyrinogen decarboxylase
MDARERFLRTARGQTVDRVPYLEEVTREEVLARWYEEGLNRTVTEDNYREFFGLDRYESIYPALEPKGGTLRNPDDFRKVEEEYRTGLPDFRQPRFWQEKAAKYRDRDFPLGITGWRGFMLPLFTHEQEWDSLQDALLALYDYPELMKSVLDLVADCFIDTIRLALRYLNFDFGLVSEPIASSAGPVISPNMFREFILPCHRKIVDFFHEIGIDVVIFKSMSNVKALLPLAVESGVDGIWITQMEGTIDYVALRRDYPELLLMGGIDSRVLVEGEDAIRAEVETKVPPLLAQGKYLPSIDDNPRENIPYKNYLAYRHILRECTS